MVTIMERNETLVSQNKRMSKKLIELNSKLVVCQQKYLSIESAFELSQKLVQHLKTENQILKSAQLNILSLDELLNQPNSNAMSTFDAQLADISEIIDENRPPNGIPSPQSDDSIDPTSGLSKSDLIAIQYENQIKELREDCKLMDCLPISEVTITSEDQMKASIYLPSNASEPVSESDSRIDVEIDVMTSKMTITPEPKVDQSLKDETRLKCKYCGRKFSDEFSLDNHKSFHKSTDGKLIRCAELLCDHQFQTKHELKEHLKSVHRSPSKLDSIKPKTELNSQTKRVFECYECRKQLSTKHSLRQHLKSAHNVILRYKCKTKSCDQTFDKWPDLRAHQQIHRNQNSAIDINPMVTPELNQEVNQTPTESPYFLYTPYGASEPAAEPQSVPQRRFVCPHEGCLSSYSHKNSLYTHEKTHHSKSVNSANTSVANMAQISVSTPTTTKGGLTADDMYKRLQLLQLFHSEQGKIAQH